MPGTLDCMLYSRDNEHNPFIKLCPGKTWRETRSPCYRCAQMRTCRYIWLEHTKLGTLTITQRRTTRCKNDLEILSWVSVRHRFEGTTDPFQFLHQFGLGGLEGNPPAPDQSYNPDAGAFTSSADFLPFFCLIIHLSKAASVLAF